MHIKQRMTVMSAVLLTLTLGVGGALGIPSVFAIKTAVGDIAAAQAKLDERYATNRYLKEAAGSIAAKKQLVVPLSDAAVLEKDELAFVTAIEAAARASRVDAQSTTLSMNTAAQKELNPWQFEVPVSVSTVGEYRNVLAFLHALESMQYLLDVTSVGLSPGSSGALAGVPGVVRADISGVALWIGKNAPAFVHGDSPKPPAP